MKTLHDINIGPAALAETYHEGGQDLAAFIELHQLADRHCLRVPGDYTRHLGISRTAEPGPYKTAQYRFRRWVIENLPPVAVQAVLDLHQMDIFPPKVGAVEDDPTRRLVNGEIAAFDYQNRLLPLFNILSSCSFWRGGATDGGAHLEIEKEFLRPDLKNLLEKLRGGEINPAQSNARVVIDAVRSRLIFLLSNQAGRKMEMGQIFPQQILLALGSLASDTASDKEKEIAATLIRDFISAFFYMKKCKPATQGSYWPYGFLPAAQDKGISDQRGVIFSQIASIGLGLDAHVVARSNASDFYNRVAFRDLQQSDVAGISEKFAGRIRVEAQQIYSKV